MDKQKQISKWRLRALNAQTALCHFMVTLEEWQREDVVTAEDFLHEVMLWDEDGLSAFDPENPWLDDLRAALTGTAQ